MTAPRTRYGATIDAVLVLLDGGRERMARTLLETLAAQISAELLKAAAAGYEAGFAEGQRALAAEITGDVKPRRPAPKQPKRLAWLAQRVRNQQLRRLVLNVLRFGDADLDRVLAGKAQLSGSQWRRLRQELGR